MCSAIVIFMPLKLPICSALLCTVVFTPPSPFNSPFTAAFPPPLAFGSAKPNREAELPIMLIRYCPSIPWAGDTGSRRRTCWLWWGLLSFAQHPTSSFPRGELQQCTMTPGLRAAWWYKTNTAIADWKWAQVKIPASNSSELWREVLAPEQELISKRVFFFLNAFFFSAHRQGTWASSRAKKSNTC